MIVEYSVSSSYNSNLNERNRSFVIRRVFCHSLCTYNWIFWRATNVVTQYMNYVTRGRKFVRDVMTRSAVKRPLMPAAIISEGVKFKKDEFHVGLQCKVMVHLRDKRCVSVNHAELSRKYLWEGVKHYEEMNYRRLYSNVVKWIFSEFSRIVGCHF